MPKTVKVGVHTYTIVRKSAAQMGNDLGQCSFDGLQLVVKQRLKKSMARETLLHEVLHSCMYPSFDGKTATDEDFVLAVAPVLLQVMQDNPELLEYLTQ